VGIVKDWLLSRTAGAVIVIGASQGYLEWTRPRRTVIQELDGYFGWYMLPSQHQFDRSLTIPEDINARGFRGVEWDAVKRPGVKRVAVLGSSMTYGSSVAFDKIYTTVAERILRARGLDVEILNCAVQNYKVQQFLRNYRRNVARLAPDVVVQAFADQDVKPMEPPRSPPRGDLRPWLTRTEFYRKFQYVWQPALRRLAPEDVKPSWARSQKDQELNEALAGRPFAPELLPLWQAAEAGMMELYNDVRAGGAGVALMVLPQPPQTMDPRFVGPELVWNRFVKAREGCSAIDAITPLRQAVAPFRARVAASRDGNEHGRLTWNTGLDDPNHVYLGDLGGHFNENGMRVIAEALAAALEPMLTAK
jgi:hypothetical protein